MTDASVSDRLGLDTNVAQGRGSSQLGPHAAQSSGLAGSEPTSNLMSHQGGATRVGNAPILVRTTNVSVTNVQQTFSME